jgi:uncharacterized protein YycO
MGMFYKVKSKVLKFMSDIRVYPLGLVLYGETGYKVKGDHIRKILNIIEPGDVLLTRYDHYLGYKLNVLGYYGHAGIYVGDDRVIHMMGDGIQNEDILTFTRKDHIMVLRSKDSDASIIAVGNAIELWESNTQYDYDFSEFNKTLYCSELVWEVYEKPSEVKKSMGKYVMPDDLICSFFKEMLKVP